MVPAALVVLTALIGVGCAAELPIAPAFASLQISANPTAIPVANGESVITVVGFRVLQTGESEPLREVTVIFTTNVGVIDERAVMQNGIARALLRSRGRAGHAFVTATAAEGLTATLASPVLIGNAGGLNIVLTANPPTVSPPDFTSELLATAFDNDNNPMPNVPIVFNASAGALASQGSLLRTNVLGQAMDRLTLKNDRAATVVALSGSIQSNEVTVSSGASLTAALWVSSMLAGRHLMSGGFKMSGGFEMSGGFKHDALKVETAVDH